MGEELPLGEMGRLNRLDVLQGEFLECSKEETSKEDYCVHLVHRKDAGIG